MSVKKRCIASPLDLQPTMNYGFPVTFVGIWKRLLLEESHAAASNNGPLPLQSKLLEVEASVTTRNILKYVGPLTRVSAGVG